MWSFGGGLNQSLGDGFADVHTHMWLRSESLFEAELGGLTSTTYCKENCVQPHPHAHTRPRHATPGPQYTCATIGPTAHPSPRAHLISITYLA